MTSRSVHQIWIARLALLLGFAGILGCEPEPPKPRQAILFMLDAARPDRFSCYGYRRTTTPEMDRLAAQGVLFQKHFAQGTYTRASVSSLLYSRYFCKPLFPSSAQVPYSSPSNLFRRPDHAQISMVRAFRLAGFKTAAISAHIWTGEGTAFGEEFDEMHDLASRLGSRERPYPSAEEVIDFAIDWVRRNKEQNYFLYVHLMDPHFPHYFEADAQAFFGASTYDSERIWPYGASKVHPSRLSEDDRRYANALYDGSLRYTDRHIGRLTEFLRKEQLIDRTVIAITADHGENLFDQPGGKTREGLNIFTHGGAWLDPVAKIPLIIHYPRKLPPGRFDGFSEGVDVAPTLLSLLDVPVPAGKAFDGIDLATVINGQVPPKKHALVRLGIRTDQYKCLFETSDDILLADTPPEPQALTGTLYDLAANPHETIDLFASRPEIVGDLLKRYRASMKARFERYEAARSSKQPESAFAIAARDMTTETSLPKTRGKERPKGWSRFQLGGAEVIGAHNTDEPLSVHFPLPNGTYGLSLKLRGTAVVEVGDQRRELTTGPGVRFGEITVTDEVFRATIQPRGKNVAVFFFGFEPHADEREDPEAAEERLQRLKSLGYIGD